MSSKPPAENKPNAEAFSEALARIEQASATGAPGRLAVLEILKESK